MKNKLGTYFIFACACLINLNSPAKAANLVKNGDFTGGNSGFSSEYNYNSANLWPEGTYTIGTNPKDVHPYWLSFGDRTTGNGNMEIVNGASFCNINVWSQTIAVNPNTEYNFSAWLASLFPEAPAQLQFSINSFVIGSPFTLSQAPGLWQQFNATWNSESNNSATISIVNFNTDFSGNDFALDEIWFEPVSIVKPPSTSPASIPLEQASVPEPGATLALLMISAFGFAGLMKCKQK